MGLDQPAHPIVGVPAHVDHEVEELRMLGGVAHVRRDRGTGAHDRAGRRLFRRDGQLAAELAEDPIGGRAPELVLRREVVRDQTLRHLRPRRDVAGARRGKAVLGERFDGGIDDACPGQHALLDSGHAPSVTGHLTRKRRRSILHLSLDQ